MLMIAPLEPVHCVMPSVQWGRTKHQGTTTLCTWSVPDYRRLWVLTRSSSNVAARHYQPFTCTKHKAAAAVKPEREGGRGGGAFQITPPPPPDIFPAAPYRHQTRQPNSANLPATTPPSSVHPRSPPFVSSLARSPSLTCVSNYPTPRANMGNSTSAVLDDIVEGSNCKDSPPSFFLGPCDILATSLSRGSSV